MQPETLSTFFRRQGYRTFKSKSCFWYDIQPGFYFNIPYHRFVTPTKEELSKILWGIPCIGVRYFSPNNSIGKSSYMVVCSDKNYDITSVDAKYARRQTRRGLENFQIRQVDFNELELNNNINIDTLIRQGRKPRIWTEKKWKLFCSSAVGLDGIEAWGAFYENHLAAFLVGYQMDDYFYIFHHSSATKYLQLYPNNALVFFITKLKLNINGIHHVSYGPQSLDAPASLETFKFRMGYQKLPMKQGIVFHPIIKPFMNNFTYSIIRRIAAGRTEDLWRKLEGILRFYNEIC